LQQCNIRHAPGRAAGRARTVLLCNNQGAVRWRIGGCGSRCRHGVPSPAGSSTRVDIHDDGDIMLKRFAALAVLAGMLVGVSACNTVEGAGKDVKATGQAIENAADKSKPK
jgi:predicted small secreted protein